MPDQLIKLISTSNVTPVDSGCCCLTTSSALGNEVKWKSRAPMIDSLIRFINKIPAFLEGDVMQK